MNTLITRATQTGFTLSSALGHSRVCIDISTNPRSAELDRLQTSANAVAAGAEAAIDATYCVHPKGAAMDKAENRWFHTPKFGKSYYFQRWRFVT